MDEGQVCKVIGASREYGRNMQGSDSRTVALDDISYHTSSCTIESDHERTRLLP